VEPARREPPLTSTSPPLNPARLDRAFALVGQQVNERLLPAAVLAVARRDGIVRCEALTRPGGDRVTVDSAFMIASLTKPITATAVMQLVDAGRLDLFAPVQSYLPEFQPPAAAEGLPGWETVSTWHLLTHTAGIQDIDGRLLARERPSAADLFRRACTGQLRFVPGSHFEYVSNSFYLLAELIGRLSGAPYREVLRTRLFEPLGMAATSFDPPPPGIGRAPVHDLGVPRPIEGAALRYLGSLAIPGGGLWSRAADLVAFGRACLCAGSLAGATVLSPGSIDLMTRDHTAEIPEFGSEDRFSHHGLGWGKPGREGRRNASPLAFEHGGATGSRLTVDPENDLVVVVLANRWLADVNLSKVAAQAVFDALDEAGGAARASI